MHQFDLNKNAENKSKSKFPSRVRNQNKLRSNKSKLVDIKYQNKSNALLIRRIFFRKLDIRVSTSKNLLFQVNSMYDTKRVAADNRMHAGGPLRLPNLALVYICRKISL